MSPQHARNYDDSPEALREQARKVANGIAGNLSDRELARIGGAARAIAEGMHETMATGTEEEKSARVAMVIGALLAMVSRTPVGEAAETLDNTIAGYSLAAAHILGVYELPPAPEGSEHAYHERHDSEPTADDGELARPAGFRYL